MVGVRRHFVAMCLTWGMISLAGFISASNTPGKPTDLRVSSVRDLTITLKWKRPLTTAGTPDNSALTYIVTYTAVGSNTHDRQSVTTESAQIDLLVSKQYKIFVKAIRPGDPQIQGGWSDVLRVNSNNLVPAKPINLHVVRVKRLTITVTWDKPQTTVNAITDTSTLNYYVSYKDLDRNTKRQIQSLTERISFGLKGDTRYEIQVRAYKVFNTNVTGPWSDSLTLKTNESTPSKPPANVKLISSTPSSIQVSWGQIPEDDRNGIIQGYVVFYHEQAKQGTWSERDVNLVYSQELTGLTTGKLYSVSVAGYTKIGRGTKSVSKGIIVGGQFITTTRKITTQKPTTLPEKPHSTIKTSRTVGAQLGTLGSASTKRPHNTTDVLSKDPYTTTLTYSSSETATKHSPQSTPDVASVGKADDGSKQSSLNKIMIIGAPAAGALLVLIIIIVFVSSIRRSRKRKQLQQNGDVPLKIFKSKRCRKRCKDVVTRGAYSVRYEPPSGDSALARDSMTEGLLQTADEPDQPVIVVQQPNGTLPRTDADDTPLLAAGDSDKCDHLRVDLSGEQRKLEEERGSGLYESIDSLSKAGCSNAAKPDEAEDEERYVTQDQIDATRDKVQAQAAPLEGHYKQPKAEALYKRPKEEDHYKSPKAEVGKDVPDDNTYENLPDADHVYESLGLKDPEDPVYENARALHSNEENIDRGEEHETTAM